MNKKIKDHGHLKPKLEPGMDVHDFINFYWLKADLTEFAKQLGLPVHGYKPELSARIERRLRGLPDDMNTKPKRSGAARDSNKPLTRDTQVVNYKSDAKTREFFKTQIGPEFHFTYHVNQFRLANEKKGITYGELIDEWIAERDRRHSDGYKPKLAEHGKYNRFIRDFFADKMNKGKPFKEAVKAWNAIKHMHGDQSYLSQKKQNQEGLEG